MSTAGTPESPSPIPAIRQVMMPRDTNPQGTIFGGVILSLIDQAAFVEALRHGNHRYVTVAMNAIEFHKPVLVGDILSLWTTVKRIGRTSVMVGVDVRALRPSIDADVQVTRAEVVLVAVNANGEPIAIRA